MLRRKMRHLRKETFFGSTRPILTLFFQSLFFTENFLGGPETPADPH